MRYRHRRCTVQRTHKELLRYETSVTAWSTANTTPQIAATDSFPDAVLPTAFNNDHPLAVDDNQEEDEPFGTNQNENEPSIIVNLNDHEPLVGLDSRDKVLSLEQRIGIEQNRRSNVECVPFCLSTWCFHYVYCRFIYAFKKAGLQ
jgi:hypothetical protein